MKKAFTLIELLIVVAIIGILASVGIPMYNGYMAEAKVNSSLTNHQSLCSLIAQESTKCNLGSGSLSFTDSENRKWTLSCPINNTKTARNYFYRVVTDTFRNTYNGKSSVYSSDIKRDKLNNSNHWGYHSLTPNGNNIEAHSNIGRTDGNTNEGDIRTCIVNVIE